MIYNSIDTIPAKLYFKLLASDNLEKDLRLLSTRRFNDINKLMGAWEQIQDEYEPFVDENGELEKTLNLSKQIEHLSAGFESVRLAIHCLRSIKDEELLKLLEGKGYKFRWKRQEIYSDPDAAEVIYQSDLDTIERHASTIQIKINRLLQKMPKQKASDTSGADQTFDQVVLGYAAFTDMGYVNPNKLPLSQYHAMITNGNAKMKALEKQAAKNKQKLKPSKRGRRSN